MAVSPGLPSRIHLGFSLGLRRKFSMNFTISVPSSIYHVVSFGLSFIFSRVPSKIFSMNYSRSFPEVFVGFVTVRLWTMVGSLSVV